MTTRKTTTRKNLSTWLTAQHALLSGGLQVTPNKVVCKDGLEFSMQASDSHYCIPRSNQGPWSQFEIGYPELNGAPFEPDEIAEYQECPDSLIYGYTPGEAIEAMIANHGGWAE